jgi:outer membrane protein
MFKKIVLFALLLIPAGAFAQEKLAYFNSSEVVPLMKEYTQMLDSLEKTQVAIRTELKGMEEEYAKKYQAFMAEGEQLVESIRVRRLTEIRDLEERANLFQQQSQEQLENLQRSLLAPIQQKVRDAIQAVGSENGFSYILDNATLLYVSPSSTDATPLVKKKLGV